LFLVEESNIEWLLGGHLIFLIAYYKRKPKIILGGHSIFFSLYYNFFLNAKKNHMKNNIS
jgi:hypothetical protein